MYEIVDVSFYKKVYPALKKYNSAVLLNHWQKNRIKKNLLGSMSQFSKTYPKFNVDVYKKYNKGLSTVGITTNAALMCHYWHFGNNERRICSEVEENCNIKDILEHYKITHCYMPATSEKSVQKLGMLYNLSTRIKTGMPIIAFNINVDDIRYIDNHDSHIYVIYTCYVSLRENIGVFLRNDKVSMIFCCDDKMKKQLDKLGIVSRLVTLNMSDKPKDHIYLASCRDNKVVKSMLYVLHPCNILENADPSEIYAKCWAIVDKEDNVDPVIKNSGIPIIQWTDKNDLLTKLINIHSESFKSSDINRELLSNNFRLNMEFFKDYHNILFVCSGDSHKNMLDVAAIIEYLNNVLNIHVHVEFYFGGQQGKGTSINKLRSSLKHIKDNHDFDIIVIEDHVFTTVREVFNCPVFYIVHNTDSQQISRSTINCIKTSHRIFSSDINIVKCAEHLNIPATMLYTDLLSTERVDAKNVTERVDTKNVIERVDAKNVTERVDTKNVTERVGTKNVTEIVDTKNVIERVDAKNVTERVDTKNVTERVDTKNVTETINYNKQLHGTIINRIPLIASECDYHYKLLRDYIFTSRSVCVVDEFDYNLDVAKLAIFQKVIDYYKLFDINIIYILFTDRTLFLHNSISNIKFVDYSNESDLEFVYMKVIHHNIDTLIVNSNAVNHYKYIDKIRMASRRIINMIDSDVTTVLDSMSGMKIKVFINFASQDIAYGGGNVFVQNILGHIDKIGNITYTFTLDNDIDIYFLVDIRTDRHFKKFSFDAIYANKIKFGGKIIYRVNDCDITRKEKSLEPMILKYVYNIDHYVFNSAFIKDYYCDNYDEFGTKRCSIVYNTSNKDIFYMKDKKLGKKIRIATHHWSDNLNKGYDYYYKLYKLESIRDDIEMVFIGRKFNDDYKDHPKIHGPYKGAELANALRECDMYITASIYDACPMHVLEGLCCGLPMLYIDHEGGGKNICEFGNNKVGEPFSNFDELLRGIDTIRNNYDMYRANIKKNMELYGSDTCYGRFMKVFMKEHLNIE